MGPAGPEVRRWGGGGGQEAGAKEEKMAEGARTDREWPLQRHLFPVCTMENSFPVIKLALEKARFSILYSTRSKRGTQKVEAHGRLRIVPKGQQGGNECEPPRTVDAGHD